MSWDGSYRFEHTTTIHRCSPGMMRTAAPTIRNRRIVCQLKPCTKQPCRILSLSRIILIVVVLLPSWSHSFLVLDGPIQHSIRNWNVRQSLAEKSICHDAITISHPQRHCSLRRQLVKRRQSTIATRLHESVGPPEVVASSDLLINVPMNASTNSETTIATLTSKDDMMGSKRQRFLDALPRWLRTLTSKIKRGSSSMDTTRKDDATNDIDFNDDTLDATILKTAIPSMINLAVVPFVNAVDTFWVGRMGIALALAGQAAANQCFFTIFFLINYLPTITAPLVARAVGSGDTDQARATVCESLFLCNLFGLLGTVLLVAFPEKVLRVVLTDGAPAFQYATPYLRIRALSMIPTLISATGFAAFRGSLDTVTPLKVSLGTNLLNLILDPLLIFFSPLGVMGAALATAFSETASGATYLILMLRRKLVRLSLMFRPPSLQALLPLILGGASMLGRQLALNIGFLLAARRAQSLDPVTGIAAAAYGIVMQISSVTGIMHIAMQGTAAALVPLTLAKSGEKDARRVADRIFIWGTMLGLLLGSFQFFMIPYLVPIFTPIPEVQDAIRIPATIASLLHVANGPVFVGEGVMLGLRCYRDLLLITAFGIGTMAAGLMSPVGQKLNGILLSFLAFCVVQAIAVIVHYLKFGPLAVRKPTKVL